MTRRLPLTLLIACTLLSRAADSGMRDWTSTDQKTIRASLVELSGDNVKLKMPDGSVVTVPLSRLSPADQAFARAPMASKPRTWPKEVEVKASAIEVKLVSEQAGARNYVYRSEAFEYSSQGKLLPSLMKEVARTFEATRQLVEALPWGIQCHPPEGQQFYLAKLFETRSDYIAAGGPTNSGGVYMTSDKTFKIPFESLGIKRLAKSYTKDDNYNNDTLVHEITHQMMHDYLLYLPTWAVEGSAEYTEMLPYKAGRFRVAAHREGLRQALEEWKKRRIEPRLPDVSQLLMMTRTKWSQETASSFGSSNRMGQLYQQSSLLVYYFNHLDGDGTGATWMRFMDATKGEVELWKNYQNEFKAYDAAMKEFFKLPGVKKLEDGRFTYPSSLTPPKAPEPPGGKAMNDQTALKHVDVLLRERTLEQLQADIVEKFKSIGVKLPL